MQGINNEDKLLKVTPKTAVINRDISDEELEKAYVVVKYEGQ